MNVPCVLFHFDEGVAPVGAFDEGEDVSFASLDSRTVAIDEVDSVVSCECGVCLLIDVEIVLTRAIFRQNFEVVSLSRYE